VRVTQGSFSYLPDLTEAQIKKQVDYMLANKWAVNIEWTDDPHPRNTYWELWGLPLFDCKDASAVMFELAECKRFNPEGYIKMQAFNPALGTESCVQSFIAYRPAKEPGFFMGRTEGTGRMQKYTIGSYAAQARPVGARY
jgi:ribulose-bisphosphate carboxylase small chain|tara:strand:- start:284 stop:703 length:420 start_codon:yes stop_codon:yes gene_type:complete